MYYFDNSATTIPHPLVLQTYQQVATKYFANPSSLHQLGNQARQLLESARKQIADILHFESDEVYFTSSGTESNHWLLTSILDACKKNRPEASTVLISAIEHPSIINHLPLLEERGYQVEVIPVTKEGQIDLVAFEKLLTNDVLLVSTMAVNNEVGAIQPLTAMAQLLESRPQILWHVDAVQAVTTQLHLIKLPRIDALSLSSHKFHAPRGTGMLTMRRRKAMAPLLIGGGQEFGMRSSTENLASIAACAKALRLAQEANENASKKLSDLKEKVIKALKANDWQMIGNEHASQHIICASYPSIPGEVIVHAFEAYQVYLSTTSACSSRKKSDRHTLNAMAINPEIANSAIRISFSTETSYDEVEVLIKTIELVTKQFNKLVTK